MHEADHVGVAFDVVAEADAEGRPFDLLHDHSGFMLYADVVATAYVAAHRQIVGEHRPLRDAPARSASL